LFHNSTPKASIRPASTPSGNHGQTFFRGIAATAAPSACVAQPLPGVTCN
jgi:hypothetical protein